MDITNQIMNVLYSEAYSNVLMASVRLLDYTYLH